MQTRFYIITALAVVISFLAGFWLANSLNKSEIATLLANQKSSPVSNTEKNPAADLELSESEIRKKLDEAKANPENFIFQKGLGLGLYRYAASRKDAGMLDDVEVLLKRAYGLNPDDYEVLVSLANVSFDLGQIKKDQARIKTARELYTKALRKNPKDVNVIADIGVSYLESENPDPEKAIAHLEEAYRIDKGNEKILVNLTLAYLKAANQAKAGEYLLKLKKINPDNLEISQIESALASEATQ